MAVIRYDSDDKENTNTKWYESLWGLIVLTLGLNILSNYIYEKGREQVRLIDQRRQKQRNIDFLEKYEGESPSQAIISEQEETEKLDKQQASGDFN